MAHQKTVNFFGTTALAMLLVAGVGVATAVWPEMVRTPVIKRFRIRIDRNDITPANRRVRATFS